MPAVSAVGGGVAGGAIGYAVGGRPGAIVGAVVGAIGGYNVDGLSSWWVSAPEVDRNVATFRADRGAVDRASSTAVAGGRVLDDVRRARLRAIGYTDDAELTPSADGDPWGSFRVRRDAEFEFAQLRLLDESAEGVIRPLLAGVTLGISDLVIGVTASARRAAVSQSIARYPSLLVWSPDYPPAVYPYQNGIKVDTGGAFGDRQRQLQLELYGPTEAEWRNNAARDAYVANVRGRRVVVAGDQLSGDSGRWGRYVQ